MDELEELATALCTQTLHGSPPLETTMKLAAGVLELKAEAKEAASPSAAKEHLLRTLLALERFEKHVGEDWGKVNLDARQMFDILTEAREDAVAFLGSPAHQVSTCRKPMTNGAFCEREEGHGGPHAESCVY